MNPSLGFDRRDDPGAAHDPERESGLALQKTYNPVVQYTLATNADQIKSVLECLPVPVAHALTSELELAGDVHRYDPSAKRAYYFVKGDKRLTVWSWNHVYRPHEAGELIYLVVGITTELDEKIANECYERATGRTVDSPWPASVAN
jgi:hypothetical protein